jgi:hypothetical protein
MKRKTFLLLLPLFLISTVWMRNLTWAQISLGARGGIVSSRPTIDPYLPATYTQSRALNGPAVGVVIEFRLTDNVSFLLEPGYVRKRMNVSWQYPVNGYDFSRRVYFTSYTNTGKWPATADYVEIPLSLKMRFLGGPVHPYITAGSAIAYKIKESFTATGTFHNWYTDPDVGFYNRYDVTVQIGAGISYLLLDPASLFAEGRYSFGLNTVDRFGLLGMKSAEWRISGGVMVEL